MTIALLLLMGYQFWGEAAHEWIGAGMFVLFIGHQVCNLNWYKNLFRGKYTPMRIFQTAINLLTLAAMLIQIYSGIILSRHVFAFLSIQGGMALARRLHILGSYWGFLLMSLHLGLHWGMILNVTAKIKNRGKAGGNKFSVVPFLAGLSVAAYGLAVFIKRDFPDYMLLKSEFVFMDYEESKFLFFMDYLALMGLCVFLSHYGIGECNFMFRFLYQIQNFFCPFPEDHPLFCQCHFAGAFCAADQQLLSQLFFHVFDLRGKCGLGEMERFGSPYNALFPCDGEKILKYPDFHIHTYFIFCYLSCPKRVSSVSIRKSSENLKYILTRISIGFNNTNGLYINIYYFLFPVL